MGVRASGSRGGAGHSQEDSAHPPAGPASAGPAWSPERGGRDAAIAARSGSPGCVLVGISRRPSRRGQGSSRPG